MTHYYHLIWCGKCKGYTVHDGEQCLRCDDIYQSEIQISNELKEEEKEPEDSDPSKD